MLVQVAPQLLTTSSLRQLCGSERDAQKSCFLRGLPIDTFTHNAEREMVGIKNKSDKARKQADYRPQATSQRIKNKE
jgi:hypothetical protein